MSKIHNPQNDQKPPTLPLQKVGNVFSKLLPVAVREGIFLENLRKLR